MGDIDKNSIVFECYVKAKNLDEIKFDIAKISPSLDWSITDETTCFKIVLFKKEGFIDYMPNYFE